MSNDYSYIKDKLLSCQKYEKFQREISEAFANFFDKGKLKPYFGDNEINVENFLSFLQKLIQEKRLKFKYKIISHLNFPLWIRYRWNPFEGKYL